MNTAQLVDRVLAGETRAISRAITLLENEERAGGALFRDLFAHTGRAFVLGITGAPGSGKSTLVDGLIRILRESGRRVAVLAIDPTSPISGGAVLGDRIRMQAHAGDRGVYIRSMASRGRLGGLAAATSKAQHILDAAGYQVIMIETVGVGQSEVDIAAAADTTLVVMTPGLGDSIQTMKAGILEVADLFALNKADLDGAHRFARQLAASLEADPTSGWLPPIIETQATNGTGLPALWSAIERHQAFLLQTGGLEARRRNRLRTEIMEAVERQLRTNVLPSLTRGAAFSALLADVAARTLAPADAAQTVLGWLRDYPASDDTP
jgi:LAO/AO transport system kinase